MKIPAVLLYLLAASSLAEEPKLTISPKESVLFVAGPEAWPAYKPGFTIFAPYESERMVIRSNDWARSVDIDMKTGKVTLAGLTADEGAKLFWEAVEKLRVKMLKDFDPKASAK